ncbi:ZIP family metal transporter [Sphingosinicella sp. BN140058]|uniref:ZIP family metal transporter n=1 Tax=Sphingosinicella sp. BN140058 TaxID=1892855 RepID=UPI00101298D5|nr:ZIP family metal transporter [Sphingosinicella sp. BN140058]QAY78419.1 ZIP family metal transporter [Sphingosinicella sp. BN140058]
MTQSIIFTGFLASLLAGLATVLGALPILSIGKPTEKQQNVFLGFAAGVMLAASFFSLIIPGIEQAQLQGAGKAQAAAIIVAAVLLGALTISQINRFVPPLDEIGLGPTGIAEATFRRVWLFVAAITLHNFPEGLAVGVSFGGGDLGAGTTTALGIGLQNIPEGLAVAAALTTIGYSARTGVLAALASGLVEPVAGLFGVTLVFLSAPLLPWGLGFAAGAMIYVVASEIIPQTHSRLELRPLANVGLMVGLGAMMFLDVSLG